MRSCNKKELEFTVFIINKLSDYLKKSVHEIYKILKDSDILDDYITGCYDVIHTLGSEYLMEDITEIIKERNKFMIVYREWIKVYKKLWGEVNEN